MNVWILVAALAVATAVFCFLKFRKIRKEIVRERQELTRKLYEISILKELGERVGYSLDIEEILQIITGSLKQFMDYTAIGFVVVTPEKIKVNTHLEESVGKPFVAEMKEKMVASLSALTDKAYEPSQIEEVVSGAIIVDEMDKKIGSLFNIPLVISGLIAGILTVAHTKKGLYREEDMTLLYKITGQASEAVTRLQEVVRMEKGKLNAMVESMGDGVLMVDSEYRVMVANPAIKNIIKFKGQGEISIFDFIDALGGKFDIRGRLEEVAAKRTSYVSERININDDFFEIGVYPVAHSGPQGESQILGVAVVFHDITGEVELERVREEFTSMIVHELRSPLDGIKKLIELVLSGNVAVDSGQFKEYMNMVHQNSASMLELVNGILDLSKLQAGKFEVNKEQADIRETIENRISFYKISAQAKNLSLESSLSGNLPPACQFDPQAVRQVLNNFISNAMKFTSQGGAVLVSAFAYKSGDTMPEDIHRERFSAYPDASQIKADVPSICIVVSDTGIGIPEGSLNDLFHTYKQVKLSRTEENRGTGLGLAIAKGIAEAHGGQVGAVSREGQGSSFFFTIPTN